MSKLRSTAGFIDKLFNSISARIPDEGDPWHDYVIIQANDPGSGTMHSANDSVRVQVRLTKEQANLFAIEIMNLIDIVG
jgi:hypothetical protein